MRSRIAPILPLTVLAVVLPLALGAASSPALSAASPASPAASPAFSAASPAAPAASPAAPSLDGKTFATQSGEKGKPAGKERDTIHFADGKFHSVACDAYGFGAAPYTVAAKDGALAWECDTTSEKEGKIHWKGEVRGAKLTGTYVWTKAGQAPIEYWIKGALKK